MNVVDILIFARIVSSICILFTMPFSPRFFAFYSLCGIGDVADGIIAHKIEFESDREAKLDGIADMVFAAIITVKILPSLKIPMIIIIWIVAIALIRFAGNFIGYRKYKTYSHLSTYANKLTGFVIYIFPFLYKVTNIYVLGFILCSIASLASVEELLIIIKSKKLNRNCRSIFDKDRF